MSEHIHMTNDPMPALHAAAADPTDIVRQYLGAHETKDRMMLEAVIGENFTFSSPEDNYINRAEYFERCWPNAQGIAAINVEKIFLHQDEAFTQFVVATKDGKQYRNTEYLKFEGGRIVRADAYFGRELAPNNLQKAQALGL